MTIQVKEISSKKDLKKFVKFQLQHYKGNDCFVPPLINDEMATFSKKKNPAFENSDAKFFLAYKDNEIVGRIVAVNNKPANKKYGTKNLRFSWFECINDVEVAKALYNSVEEWGRELGMETITGPHGFCDFDPQGMLFEGFDELATIASFYNYSYYNDLTVAYGFEKDVDYHEYVSKPPYETGIPDRLVKSVDWIKERKKYKLADYKSVKQYLSRADEMFDLLEESFSENYGTVPITKKQQEYYTKKYISYINPELIKYIFNEKDELIGFMITMPSLSRALQKAKGRMFPFGIFHILKGFKTFDILDFYFAGVREDYRGKGVDAVMALDIAKSAMKLGFKIAESNQELEDNFKVQAQWKFFQPELRRRRRIYKKAINSNT